MAIMKPGNQLLLRAWPLLLLVASCDSSSPPSPSKQTAPTRPAGTAERHAETAPATSPDAATATRPAGAVDLGAFPHQAASAESTYFVALVSEPDPIRLNDTFTLKLHVAANQERSRPVEGVVVAVDADMPEHGHGMTTTPRVTRGADGLYHVQGMRFHMSGYWEIYVDVSRDGVTERAIVPLTLE